MRFGADGSATPTALITFQKNAALERNPGMK